VNFAILGPAETCTGDPARRMGNEFVYSMLAQQNIETLNDAGLATGAGKTIVASCPHCFNTIANEYPQLGGHSSRLCPRPDPDEFVWTRFKATLANGRPDNLDELMVALCRITKKARKRTELLRSFITPLSCRLFCDRNVY